MNFLCKTLETISVGLVGDFPSLLFLGQQGRKQSRNVARLTFLTNLVYVYVYV